MRVIRQEEARLWRVERVTEGSVGGRASMSIYAG